ncbi:MAG: hypothetical protein V4598_18260 [Bdellovibrionota bacterium]
MRLLLPLLLVLISCGGSHSKKKSSASTPTTPAVNQEQPTPPTDPVEPEVVTEFTDQGKFTMSFSAVNPKIFNYKGTGSLNIDAPSFSSTTKATHAPFLRTVYQNLYQGTCPTLADDRNGDGIVDIEEASEVLGTKLMALDSNLENAESNLDKFPRTNIFGYFSFSTSGRVAKILPQFEAGSKIDPADLVVLTQGLPSYVRLPASVRSTQGISATETLPVACATLSAAP